ncbi:hypothetical protein BJ741DRAFT_111679 [Chytriomyces cf. hyalinus JEL632]|nr:hypothetical protein BJ741DRAFT_111679 [Chytriomyces cf. hyalinus JEL632]
MSKNGFCPQICHNFLVGTKTFHMHLTRERSKEPRPKSEKNRSSGERKRSQSLDNTRGSSSGQAARGKEAGLSSKAPAGAIQANGSAVAFHFGVSRNGRRATGTGPSLSNQYGVKEKALSYAEFPPLYNAPKEVKKDPAPVSSAWASINGSHGAKLVQPTTHQTPSNPWKSGPPSTATPSVPYLSTANVHRPPATFSQVLSRPLNTNPTSVSSASTTTTTTSTTTQTIPFSGGDQCSASTLLAHQGQIEGTLHVLTPQAPYATARTEPIALSIHSKIAHVGTMTNVSMAEFFGNGTLNPVFPQQQQQPHLRNGPYQPVTDPTHRIPAMLPVSSIAMMGINAPVPVSVIGPPVNHNRNNTMGYKHQYPTNNQPSTTHTVYNTYGSGFNRQARGLPNGKRLSAFAAPFIPGGYNANPGASGVYHGRDYSDASSSTFMQPSYRGSVDDMEVSASSWKKSISESRQSRKKRQNGLDYYYSEDEDWNETANSVGKYRAGTGFLAGLGSTSPAMSYTASATCPSVHPDDDGRIPDDFDGDADKMSISSEESVEFVINKETARCLPLFLTEGVNHLDVDAARLKRSASASANRNQGCESSNLYQPTGWGATEQKSTLARKRSVSVSATPPTIFREISSHQTRRAEQYAQQLYYHGQQQQQQQFHSQAHQAFAWNPNGSVSKPQASQPPTNHSSTVSNKTSGSALRSFLNASSAGVSGILNPARTGRSQRRHSNTHQQLPGRPSQRTSRHTKTAVRRSLSISDVKTKNDAPLCAIEGAVLNALASMSVKCDLKDKPVFSSGFHTLKLQDSVPLNLANPLQLPPSLTLPNLSRFEFQFSKRYWMDLEIPVQYRIGPNVQRTQARKTAEIRRCRNRVSSSSECISTEFAENSTLSSVPTGQHVGQPSHEDPLLLMRTASEPSLLSRSLAAGASEKTLEDCSLHSSHTLLAESFEDTSFCGTDGSVSGSASLVESSEALSPSDSFESPYKFGCRDDTLLRLDTQTDLVMGLQDMCLDSFIADNEGGAATSGDYMSEKVVKSVLGSLGSGSNSAATRSQFV